MANGIKAANRQLVSTKAVLTVVQDQLGVRASAPGGGRQPALGGGRAGARSGVVASPRSETLTG